MRIPIRSDINVTGTSSGKDGDIVVDLECSDECEDITATGIDITPPSGNATFICKNIASVNEVSLKGRGVGLSFHYESQIKGTINISTLFLHLYSLNLTALRLQVEMVPQRNWAVLLSSLSLSFYYHLINNILPVIRPSFDLWNNYGSQYMYGIFEGRNDMYTKVIELSDRCSTILCTCT